MARNKREIIIDSGRDEGKRFIITELPAFEAEKMLFDTISIITKSVGKNAGAEIGDDPKNALFAILGGVDNKDLTPIFDKLLTCVKYQDKDKIYELKMAGIEDVTTILKLKKEAVAVHTDFLTEEHPVRQFFSKITEMGKSILDIQMSGRGAE